MMSRLSIHSKTRTYVFVVVSMLAMQTAIPAHGMGLFRQAITGVYGIGTGAAAGTYNYLRGAAQGELGLWTANPFQQLGNYAFMHLGVGFFIAKCGYKGLAYAAALVKQYPGTAAGLGLYALLANKGQLLDTVQQRSPVVLEGAKNAVQNPAIQHGVNNVENLVRQHYAENKDLIALYAAIFALWHGARMSVGLWDYIINKNGLLVVDAGFKTMAIPAEGKLHLAGWAIDKAPDATTLYHEMLDGDKTLRAAFMLAYRSGTINGWKVPAGDIVTVLLEKIESELKIIAAMQEQYTFYAPTASDMLKEARKDKDIMLVGSQRHHSNEKKEEKYWKWLGDKSKDPGSAKPNTWMEPIYKSVDAFLADGSIKIPNIFWRIYPYYGKALLLYASLEQRKERLIGLKELVQLKFPCWWEEECMAGTKKE